MEYDVLGERANRTKWQVNWNVWSEKDAAQTFHALLTLACAGPR